jgi:streptogramin lyase
MIMRSDVGKDRENRPILYTVILGNPAVLSIVDLNTGKVVKSLPLPETSGAWGVKVSTDNTVYLGAYNKGLLYRYSPETGELKNLGHPIKSQDAVLYPMDAMPDGKIYGGTYPSGHAYEFDPKTEQFRDLGDMTTTSEKERWIRVTVADPRNNKLYFGIGNQPQLVEYDLTTGSKRDLLAPEYADITSVYDLNVAGGRLFCRKETANPYEYFVLDVATSKMVTVTNADTGEKGRVFINMSRGLSPVSPAGNKMYYSDDKRRLCEYDLDTNTVRALGFNTGSALTGYAFVNLNDPEWPGYTLVGTVGNQPRIYKYNLQTGKGVTQTVDLPGQPVNIHDIITGPDGSIYTGGYLAGNMGRYDPTTGSVRHLEGSGQTEGLAVIGDRVYLGTYPDARIFEYDIRSAWDPRASGKSNPASIFDLTNNERIPGYTSQDRPWAMAGSDELKKLFVGTTPKNGMLGGVLAVWDAKTRKEPEVYWNLVPDQSIVSLLVKDGLVYGGSSVWGGMGVEPRAKEAELFIWDPVQKKKIFSLPPVAGKTSVSVLHAGPDGNVWGLASGTFFVFDPRARKVIYTRNEFPEAGGRYREGSFVNHRDGSVYGTAGGFLFKVDPATRKFTRLATGATRVVQDKDGRLYTYGHGRTVLYQYDPTR